MNRAGGDYLDFPYHIDGRGRTALTDEDDHIRDLVHQVLFTNPGERVNRPDFGCGLGQLVFMPAGDSLAAVTQFLVQGALTRWLDDVIAVHRVDVVPEDTTLTVNVVFSKRSTGEQRDERFLSPWRV
ncbi:GPW/gp25 family protein [Streptomyces sp. NPDC101393]|uniref:GPW/gp25 family protein n=1 Tax=Streptomyces sp. NPDC101393 TaxID=3366141 RepID=UPI0038199A7F